MQQRPFRPKRNPVPLGQVAHSLLDDPRSPFFPFSEAIKKSMAEETEPTPTTPSQLTLFAAPSQRDQVTARDRRLNYKRNGNGNGH
jgi:hypothetical protein